MALPLPRAAALPLLLLLLAAPLLCAAQGPISQPPSPGARAPTASPHLNHPDSPPADGDEGGKSISPSVAPAPGPADDGEKAASPPAPIETAPAEAPAPLHSTAATPAPAPAAAEGEAYNKKKKKGKSPAPAPAAMEVKSSDGDERAQALDEAEKERREGMSGGKKAGVVVGVFSAVALVGLGAVVYKKRQANIRRSRYADYSARLELV